METWIARSSEVLLCAPLVGGSYRHGFETRCEFYPFVVGFKSSCTYSKFNHFVFSQTSTMLIVRHLASRF